MQKLKKYSDNIYKRYLCGRARWLAWELFQVWSFKYLSASQEAVREQRLLFLDQTD